VTVLYRVRARNLATTSTNKIHDDTVARRFGFAGGLVPGVDVYAYATHPVVEHFGNVWLSNGAMTVRFEHPVYDGHETTVEREPSDADDAPALVVRNERGERCAVASARVGTGAPPPLDDEPSRPLPDPRPVASTENLPVGARLGDITTRFDAQRAVEYLDGIRETLPIYRDDAVAHPGWLLRRANRILAANVTLGPWIHVGSDVRLFARVHDGARVRTTARVVRVWERRGHKFVTLDVVITAGEPATERVVMRAEHTAIYEPRAREPD
jgi:acyl dehydratase